MKGNVHYEKRGAVAVLTIDNPPVNALSSGVRQGLYDHVQAAMGDGGVKAIVLVGKNDTFIAGADITEFGDPNAGGANLLEVLERIEQADKLVVAAIAGNCLGGGLETALCCDYRIAAQGARLGLPEVNLGLLPGAGGTQRLPRVIGAMPALNFMITGKPMDAATAKEHGLVDEVVEGDLLQEAIAFAERTVEEGGGKRRVRDLTERRGEDRSRKDEILEFGRKLAKKTRRKQHAPERIIACVEAALDADDFDAGLQRERELFLECLQDSQHQGLTHIFFAERKASKIPDVPRDTPTSDIRRAAIVGGGTMGRGIAMAFANAGIPVRLLEADREKLEAAQQAIRGAYEGQVAKGKMTQGEVAERIASIEGTLEYDALSDCDVAVEAVFEEMDLKKKVFGELDRVMRDGALLATNTSTLDVDAIGGATKRPESVVGMHFFSPAHVMKLLEVVRGEKSSKPAIATAMKLGKRLGKVAVLAGNCDGFIGNRMLAGYTREAVFLLEEGALPHQVDLALLKFGMPMGPFAMMDLAGLDVGWRIRKQRGRPEGVRYSELADKLCEMGRFGQKTRAGWYEYAEGSRTPERDEEVEKLIVETSEGLGMDRREISEREIAERCIYPLVNEGARILEEGIAIRPGDIDVVYVYGYGFPPFRGGPMHYADHIGLQHVLERIRHFHQQHGELWKPAPLLEKLATDGKTFGSLEQ
ncbi:MAG: 3-hydroxyacyl-CoA dehydrogenase NAD-binding domain-containing protein [Myxococcota bacterium]